MDPVAARNQLIRAGMPKTADMVQELRKRHGDAWVTECIKRGMAGEPGWFWAWEAGVSIGLHWVGVEAEFVVGLPRAGQTLVMVRPKEGKT